MEKIKLWLSIVFGIIASVVWLFTFFWIFFLLDRKDLSKKWNAFMDAVVFNRNL